MTRWLAADPPLESRSGQYRFGTTLTVAMVFSSITPFAVGALSPYMVAAFDLSRAQLGTFMTVSYASATCLSLPLGHLVDRVHDRRLLAGIVLLAAGSLVGLASVRSYGALLALAIPTGIATASGNPLTNRLVAAHSPEEYRERIIGLKQAGVQAGSFVAGFVLPALAVMVTWRGSLVATALAALVCSVVVMRIIPGVSAVPPPTLATTVPARRSRIPILCLVGYAFFMGGAVSSIVTHLSLFAHEDMGFAKSEAGLVLGVVSICGIAARIAWGALGERISRASAALGGIAFAGAGASVLLSAASASRPWMLWVGAVVFGLSASAWNSVGMIAVLREAGNQQVGRATGLISTGFFGGFILSPVAFGAVADSTGSYHLVWLGVAANCVVAAALAAVWARHGSR